ncbi:hypothetical protein OG423_05805 [Micromonospora zamorensis]|uniref:hypothetical protein n=1 Tax=Micromonospora zamorensis TaxID=709883 RepID=UPI00352A3474|nr:hypothetical protein OG423_05805 [Micromonospora zamorensis]
MTATRVAVTEPGSESEKGRPEQRRNDDVVDDRLERLRLAIAEHPGTQADTRWSRLRRTHALLASNLRELSRLIDRPEGDSWLALDLVSNTGSHNAAQEAFFDEFDRLLHNAVAAIGTLIDHTRIVARHYEGSRFHDEYGRRIGNVAVLPAARFVKDLRNYMLHRSLPAPYSQVDLHPQQVSYQLLISVPALLEFSAWSAASREYLASHGSMLPIREPLDEYAAAIDDLYEWMFTQSAQLDVAHIEAANALIDEYNDVLIGRRE